MSGKFPCSGGTWITKREDGSLKIENNIFNNELEYCEYYLKAFIKNKDKWHTYPRQFRQQLEREEKRFDKRIEKLKV
ncbi:MAG TPA: hypothetical protein ENI23_00465 [bacterium]|nr:hypothetical protein [bacterium]